MPPSGVPGVRGFDYTQPPDCENFVGNYAIGPMANLPWIHCATTNVTTNTAQRCLREGDSIEFLTMQWNSTNFRVADATIELDTGGKPGITNQALFRIRPEVFDYGASQFVHPTNITVLGERCDTNGYVYKMLSDHTKVGVTPSLPARFTNYGFSVTHQKAQVQILRGSDPTSASNITDSTVTVVVGERVTLHCVLSSAIGTLTNQGWSVPGNRIRDWVADSQRAEVHELTNLALPSISFVWRDALVNGVVQCSVTIRAGTNFFPVTAKAKFNVIRPTATWNGAVTGVIACDTAHPNSGSLPSVHFGVPSTLTPNSNGITFFLSGVNLNGYSGSFSFSCVQVGSDHLIYNHVDGKGYQYSGVGVDETYPYAEFGMVTNATQADSPGATAFPYIRMLQKNNSFETYLLFKPTSGPSIPVPLRRFSWSWSGRATNYFTTDGIPIWGLESGVYPDPNNLTGISVTVHPTWTNNVLNRHWTTNAVWFP